MLIAISIQDVDPAREDVYLASVDDQERAIAESPDFVRRTVLRGQARPAHYWLLDEWRDQQSMQLALAMARTIASVAALVDEPREVIAEADEIGRGFSEPAAAGFCLVAEGWVKEACLAEYESTVRAQTDRLREEPGFLRRVLLVDEKDHLHRWVLDEWSSERAAYDSFQGSTVTEGEALRFLALFAERGTPLFATTVHRTEELKT